MTMAALPKSASAYVCNFSAVALGMPSCRVAVGNVVVPNWARRPARGGGINHEHFPATPDNVRALAEAGIRRIAILVRDPRQQLVSLMHHQIKDLPGCPLAQDLLAAPERERVDAMLRRDFFTRTIDWVGGWLAEAGREGSPLSIDFVTFEELVRDPAAFFRALWLFFGMEVPVANIAAVIDSPAGQDMRWNFRKGETDEWRSLATPATQASMWARMPRAVGESLRLAGIGSIQNVLTRYGSQRRLCSMTPEPSAACPGALPARRHPPGVSQIPAIAVDTASAPRQGTNEKPRAFARGSAVQVPTPAVRPGAAGLRASAACGRAP